MSYRMPQCVQARYRAREVSCSPSGPLLVCGRIHLRCGFRPIGWAVKAKQAMSWCQSKEVHGKRGGWAGLGGQRRRRRRRLLRSRQQRAEETVETFAGRVSQRHKPFARPDGKLLFGPGRLGDGLGWELFGRAGRSGKSVTAVSRTQTVNGSGSRSLSPFWHAMSRANKGAAEMGLLR